MTEVYSIGSGLELLVLDGFDPVDRELVSILKRGEKLQRKFLAGKGQHILKAQGDFVSSAEFLLRGHEQIYLLQGERVLGMRSMLPMQLVHGSVLIDYMPGVVSCDNDFDVIARSDITGVVSSEPYARLSPMQILRGYTGFRGYDLVLSIPVGLSASKLRNVGFLKANVPARVPPRNSKENVVESLALYGLFAGDSRCLSPGDAQQVYLSIISCYRSGDISAIHATRRTLRDLSISAIDHGGVVFR